MDGFSDGLACENQMILCNYTDAVTIMCVPVYEQTINTNISTYTMVGYTCIFKDAAHGFLIQLIAHC